MTTLYHGAHEAFEAVKPGHGTFGGIFASANRRAAESHGPFVVAVDVADDRMLTSRALRYDVDHVAVEAILRAELHAGADVDAVYDALVADCAESDELAELLGLEYGEAGWELQRLRGVVARELGYDAVEMRDEHGQTWLVVGAVSITRD